MRAAVTGATGLLGWHVRCAMHAAGIESESLGRNEFGDERTLGHVLAGVDVVVHAAGANPGSDDDVAATNVGLAERLVAGIKSSGSAPYVIYLDSKHRSRSTAYGRSKRAAAEILAASASPFLDLVLPGIFGEHGKPYYNSVVSTFCHQLTNGLPLSICDDAELELVHAQDVADDIIDAVRARRVGQCWVPGHRLTVAELGARLRSTHEIYEADIVPPLDDSFDRSLFNTLRSFRFPGLYPIKLRPNEDERGRLVELVKSDSGGQTFVSTTAAGVTRGNHYHRRKVERFVVLEGRATISLRRMFTDDVVTFHVTGREPVAIDMPTLHTHNITNVGEHPLITAFWADEIFDHERPDTIPEQV